MRQLSFFERILGKQSNDIQFVYSSVALIIFAIGLISSIGFLNIYFFLYGYYFGGEGHISNFSIISNLIPFNIQTLSIISIFLICIYYTISGLLSILREKDKKIEDGSYL